jgi:hypothetical protein
MIYLFASVLFLAIGMGNLYYYFLKLKSKAPVEYGSVNLAVGITCLIGSIGAIIFGIITL